MGQFPKSEEELRQFLERMVEKGYLSKRINADGETEYDIAPLGYQFFATVALQQVLSDQDGEREQ